MKKLTKIAVAVLLVFAFAFSTVVAFVLAGRTDSRDRDFSLMLAARVYDTVNEELMRPVIVSLTMAHDTMLTDWLLSESDRSQEENDAQMQHYLAAIKEHFDYASAFVISEATHCYYTYKGLNKVINPLEDPHDMWYSTFLRRNLDYLLDSDLDQMNENRWTLFVNCRKQDSDGSLLGVVGVGVVMDNMQRILKNFEDEYGIKILLVDKTGLVQVSSDYSNIQNRYLTDIRFDMAEEQFAVLPTSDGFRIVHALKGLPWYLSVQIGGNKSASKLHWLPYLNGGALLVLLLALFAISLLAEKNLLRKEAAPVVTDAVTGLPNRSYFAEAYGEHGIFNTTRYKALAVLNIDRFSIESASRSGDSIIQAVAAAASDIVGEQGIILRWGDDTFIMLLELEMADAGLLCELLCKNVRERASVTISIGITQIDLTETIKKNYYRAVQSLFAAKEAGGNTVRQSK